MLRYLVFLIVLFFPFTGFAQQDMDLHVTGKYLQGKNVLKVKRDYLDPNLWVLVDGNQVFRINSITGNVDDMTSAFSAYTSGVKLIDIAAVSTDRVFVATNATNVLEYKGGTVRSIGSSQSLSGVVNSIALLPYPTYQAPNMLIIATDRGTFWYEFASEKVVRNPVINSARILETNYRSLMTTAINNCGCTQNGVEPTGINSFVDMGSYAGWLWVGGSFGNELRSAYFSRYSHFYNSGSGTYSMRQFWATENGLFQNEFHSSHDITAIKGRYLQGQNITKITSIYGLLGFYSNITPKSSRENILVGTKNGLYFSDSKYPDLPGEYTFSYCSELGNKAINDIGLNIGKVETSIFNYKPVSCEDGIWVAATDGLYLLRPDYTPYVDKTEKVQAIMIEGQPGVSEFSGCGSVRAVPTVNGTGLFFQWYKDGAPLANQNSPIYTITSPGDYYAVLTDPCANVSKESNHLKVEISGPPVFKFDYPDKMEFCSGSTATLSVTDKLSYTYRWYKDGQLDNNRTNVMNTTRPGRYRLELTNCTGDWIPTKEVEIVFVKVPTPAIKADKAAYCVGEQAVLTATVPSVLTGVINWQPYQYQWYKDGVKIGSSTATINVSQAGKYKVEVTACAGNTTVSADLQMNFISIATPIISASKTAYCKGDLAALSVNFVNDGTYTLNWLRNGAVLPAEKNKLSINTTQAGNYTVNITSNLTSCSQASAAYNLSFEDQPTIFVSRVINTPLCSGQAVDLTATYSGGKLKWNTGETTDRISIKAAGTYTATATTATGCAISGDIDVQFLPNPTLAVPNAALCQFTGEKITLTAPAGFVKYEWNGQPGTAQYTAGAVGSVTLKVTDNNGCTASQTISITSKCKDIHIPNTFTPNGDGVNDKWLITGIEGDATVTVNIYTRTGTPILQSRGYVTPWDGTHNGTKVPAGVYYYVIGAKGAQQQLSGSITVLY